MSARPAHQLLDLHASLYQRAYAAAHAHTSVNSSLLKSYAQNFQKMLPDLFWQCSEQDTVTHLMKNDILLYGDFHTLKQSQRGLLRILRLIKQTSSSSRPIVLALEMFDPAHQKYLDAFMNGTLDDEEFRAKIQYEKTWGFSWDNYAPLLEFAKEQGWLVYGIDSKRKRTKSNLATRDQSIAKELLRLKNLHDKAFIVSMIGEYHLADEHLPRQLKQLSLEASIRLKITRLINNTDRYYFSLLRVGQPHGQSEYLKLKEDLYCLINTPAWMKWRSLANWEELAGLNLKATESFDDDDEFASYSEGVDLDHQFYEILSHLSTFLQLPRNKEDLLKFNFCTKFDEDVLAAARKEHGTSKRAMFHVLEKLERNGFLYFPTQQAIVLKSLNLNAMAKVAGSFIQNTFQTDAASDTSSKYIFYRNVLNHAASTVSSGVLNPRRKIKTIDQYKKFWEQTKKLRLSGDALTARDLAKFVLSHHNAMVSRIASTDFAYATPEKSSFTFDEKSSYALSTALGELLGAALVEAYLANQITLSSLQKIFNHSLHTFESVWALYCDLHMTLSASSDITSQQAV